MKKLINTIPEKDWEEMFAAVSAFPNKVALVKALKGGPMKQDRLPLATRTENWGASQESVNAAFRKAGLPYRIRGYMSHNGWMSIRKSSNQKANPAVEDYCI